MPRLGVKAYLSALPVIIKHNSIFETWQAYVCECLRTITVNTAKYVGGNYVQAKWTDIVDYKPKDTRTGEEIATEVIKKAGLKLNFEGRRGNGESV